LPISGRTFARAHAEAFGDRPKAATKNGDDAIIETYLRHANVTGYYEREARAVWALYKQLADNKPLKARDISTTLTFPARDRPSVVGEAGELRDYVKNLPANELNAFVTDAIERGDIQVLDSILNASPGFLD
jgi:hypothetical protein